jgi:hypothetical protein
MMKRTHQDYELSAMQHLHNLNHCSGRFTGCASGKFSPLPTTRGKSLPLDSDTYF